MRQEHTVYLCCPACRQDVRLISAREFQQGIIEDGVLECVGCSAEYKIVRGVPRFVRERNYAASFGYEWRKHPTTQYDSQLGVGFSAKRFFDETQWDRHLFGEVVMEAGCGSGRFTEQAASTGAMVLSLDLSQAVDANYASNGRKDNVLIVQGDIYAAPFKDLVADKVFCLGVLQHLPDPKSGFLSLLKHLKPGGSVVIDVYSLTWKTIFKTNHLVRPLTKRLPPQFLYRWVRRYVDMVWPLCRLISKLPYGRQFNRIALMIADQTGQVDVSDAFLKELAILDTFDWLSPYYDKPQLISTVRRWFADAELESIDVRYGYNGIQARGIKPCS
ncbi:MAG: methyltransferase domain-containing protein [Desulfomonilaceae bacterium]